MSDRSSSVRKHPVLQLTLMRMREATREPGTIFWVFMFPILVTIALGLAFRSSKPAPVVAAALPGITAEVVQALSAAGVVVRRLDEVEARRELRSRKVAVLISPPNRPGGTIAYRFDPESIESQRARLVVDDAVQRAAGRRDPRPVSDEPLPERGMRYVDFLIPGLIGMNLMSGSMWGIGWALVDMRIRRLLKRLLVTPMRRRHLLYAHGLARLVLIPLEVVVLLVFARLAFDVRVTGSALALAVLCIAGGTTFAAIAVLTASRAQNGETVTGLINLVMTPMFIVSGVFFSASHFPQSLQPFISALPLTALNDSLRAVIVDGATLGAVLRPLGVMAAWAGISFIAGLRLFRWA